MEHSNLKVVFFHELGHFIAHELNYEFSGFGKVEMVKFITLNNIHYEGQTIPFLKKNQTRNDKVVNLPEKIAELIYGCYFQSIYTNLPLKFCLDTENKSSSGYLDAKYIESSLFDFKIMRERQSLYPYLHIKYYEQLKSSSLFKELFSVNCLDFLEPTDFGYTANILKLEKLTENFRGSHKNDFNEFIFTIKDIINWRKTCGNNV